MTWEFFNKWPFYCLVRYKSKVVELIFSFVCTLFSTYFDDGWWQQRNDLHWKILCLNQSFGVSDVWLISKEYIEYIPCDKDINDDEELMLFITGYSPYRPFIVQLIFQHKDFEVKKKDNDFNLNGNELKIPSFRNVSQRAADLAKCEKCSLAVIWTMGKCERRNQEINDTN